MLWEQIECPNRENKASLWGRFALWGGLGGFFTLHTGLCLNEFNCHRSISFCILVVFLQSMPSCGGLEIFYMQCVELWTYGWPTDCQYYRFTERENLQLTCPPIINFLISMTLLWKSFLSFFFAVSSGVEGACSEDLEIRRPSAQVVFGTRNQF